MNVVFIVLAALVGASMLMTVIGIAVVSIVRAQRGSQQLQRHQHRSPQHFGPPVVPVEDIHQAIAEHAAADQVLLIRCRECDRLNEEHHKFCFECGAAMT